MLRERLLARTQPGVVAEELGVELGVRAPKCRTRTCSDDIDDPVIRHSSTTTFLALRAVAD